jgi:hypothetical protein
MKMLRIWKKTYEMEEIAKKYDGVEDAYAFEAGRELKGNYKSRAA